MSEKISSALLQSPNGGLFSTLSVDGSGIVIKNASDDQRSDGTFVPAGSDTLVLSAVGESSFLNASYMKVGVLDASLLRTGLLQTVASWNSKWYGSAEDSMDVQQGFAGGKFAVTGVSTTANSVTLTGVVSASGGLHNITASNYVRVSGLIFGDDTYGNVGIDSPGVGAVAYADVTGTTSTTITYELTGVGSGKTTLDPYSLPFVSKVVTVVSASRLYDDELTNDNPGELSKVTVVTASAHGLSAGNYVELAGIEDSLNGVWRVSGAPTSTTFEFWQRFVEDLDWENDDSITLPEYGTPVAIEVAKSYRVTSDGTLMAYGAVFNPAGTRRSAILLRGGGTQGDIAVPADETLQIGYRDGAGGLGGTFTSIMTINTPASGNQGATVINGSLTVDTLTATTINGGSGSGSVPDDITAHTITTTAGNIRIRPYENDGSAADKRGELEFYTQIASTGYYTSRVMAFSDKDYGNALVIDPDLKVLGDAQVVGDLTVSGALTAGSFSIGTLNATTVNASSGYYNYLDVGNVATKHAVIQPNGQLTVNNDTNSTSANTGAVVIKGGAYVAQDLRVDGTIYVNTFSPDSITMGVGDNIVSQGYISASAGYYGSIVVGTGVGSKMEVDVGGQVTLNNSTAATAAGGALYIPTGGIRALTGNIGTLTVTSTFSPASLSISGGGGISVTGGGNIATTSSATANTMSATNGYYLNFAAGSSTKALIDLTGQLTVQNTATSTSKSGVGATGSVVIAGDVSVAKKIWAADVDITGSLTGGFTLGAITPSSVVSSYGYYTSLNGTTLSIGSSTPATIGAAGKVTIANTTSAISTTSGALEVAGGVGIGGNLYVGGTFSPASLTTSGNISITGATSSLSVAAGGISTTGTISGSNGYYSVLGATTFAAGSTVTGTRVSIGSGGVLTVANVTQASSVGPAGSIVTSGGIYVAKDIVVGGNISGGFGAITPTSVVSSYGYYTSLNGTTLSIGSSSATTISAAGKVTIANNTAASSITSGALEVVGGVGITGNLYVGGSINGTIALPSTISASTGYYNTLGSTTLEVGSTGAGATRVSITSDGTTYIKNADNTTGSTTGALIVSGGVYVARDLRVADDLIVTGTLSAGTFSPSSVVSSYGYYTSLNGTTLSIGSSTAASFTAAGALRINNVTQSTTTTSGALTVDGGVGIAKDVVIGGTITAASYTGVASGAGSVTSSMLDAGSVTESKIATDAVSSTKILAGAVGQTELSTTAIFKSVTPTTIAAVASSAAGWSGSTGAAGLRRFTGTVTSERAFKSDISAIAPETDKYELLNWITFRYDAQKMRDYGLVSAGIDYEVPDKKNWGLIADELQELFPEAVVLEQTDEGSFRGINYQTLRAIEGMVIKDLIGRIKILESKVAELEVSA